MTTIDVEQQIHSEVEAMRLAILNGTDYVKPPRQRRAHVPKQGPGRGSNLRGRGPDKYDRQEVRRLFEQGLTVNQIAEALGAHRGTAWRILNDMGIQPAPKVGGPKRKDRCGRDLHDMEEHGRPVKGGGRYCVLCKAEQGAKNYERKKSKT
jgi:hypothetical protein